jgi:hypothetical protein
MIPVLGSRLSIEFSVYLELGLTCSSVTVGHFEHKRSVFFDYDAGLILKSEAIRVSQSAVSSLVSASFESGHIS